MGNGCNRFTWFNMGWVMKNDRCLSKTIETENMTVDQGGHKVEEKNSNFSRLFQSHKLTFP